ncbi:hypothetical protein BDP27DRAFT_1339811 [Rhodocollybia butyracea]|uniref:Fe2OG dioxygenase domain-containing protein n=1 Tax=Rhodocollybia butyracea TaxID=206335 RepID=A0A9P5PDX1_9AGAR|nr:hypothetical protein BDP27DRAFT_1339811 [Rhodocollybia butyracea]
MNQDGLTPLDESAFKSNDLKRKIQDSSLVANLHAYGKRIKLHVDIPTMKASVSNNSASDESEMFSSNSLNSLFDEVSSVEHVASLPTAIHPALRTAPPIPGLFYDPSVNISDELAEQLVGFCSEKYFDDGRGVNQIMLFERAKTERSNPESELPPLLSDLLRPPVLPPEIHELLFPSSSPQSADPLTDNSPILVPPKSQARQAILNLYAPGEGISAHVDLLRRFGDGIVGVSLRGSCVMRFEKVKEDHEDKLRNDTASTSSSSDLEAYELYLPRNSIIVLTGDARYKWTHEIEKKVADWVEIGKGGRKNNEVAEQKDAEAEWIPRSTRLSITFRWLLPGADVVGGDEPYDNEQ